MSVKFWLQFQTRSRARTYLLVLTEIIKGCTLAPKRLSIFCHQSHSQNRALACKIIRKWKRDECFNGQATYVDCVRIIQSLSRQKLPHVAQELLLEMKSDGLLPSNSTLSALMLFHANNGLFPQAEAVWNEMLYSSFVPSIQMRARYLSLFSEVYSLAISCFGKGGQLELMEGALKEMMSMGFPVDSATGNAFIRYYSIFGSLTEMETAYDHLKKV
ncbi:hypothetical protein ACFX2B_012781 [Malus domestica]